MGGVYEYYQDIKRYKEQRLKKKASERYERLSF